MGKSSGGRPSKDGKLIIEGICYILRTGTPWRDLSKRFGPWKSVYTRWRRRRLEGLWAHLLKKIAGRGYGTTRPVAMRLAPANRHDLKAYDGLWKELRGGWLVADRAFDSDKLRSALAAHGIFACIPLKSDRRKNYFFSKKIYTHRHTVENANARLKSFRRIGTRYDKLSETFLAFVLLASCLD